MKIPWNWKIKLLFNFTIFLIKDIFLGCRVAKKEPYNKDKIKEDQYNVGAMNLRMWYKGIMVSFHKIYVFVTDRAFVRN